MTPPHNNPQGSPREHGDVRCHNAPCGHVSSGDRSFHAHGNHEGCMGTMEPRASTQNSAHPLLTSHTPLSLIFRFQGTGTPSPRASGSDVSVAARTSTTVRDLHHESCEPHEEHEKWSPARSSPAVRGQLPPHDGGKRVTSRRHHNKPRHGRWQRWVPHRSVPPSPHGWMWRRPHHRTHPTVGRVVPSNDSQSRVMSTV